MRWACKAGCGKTFSSRGGEYAHRQRHHPETVGRRDAAPTPPSAAVEAAGEAPTRRHTEIQMLLARLGKQLNCDVWIPAADQGNAVGERRLSELSLNSFPPLPLGDAASKIIQNIDVVWIRNKAIEAAFEVESTTSVYSGLLRLSDLLASQPNINIRLYILAEERRRIEVWRNVTRPTFADLDLPNRVRFMSFERLSSEFSHLAKYAESPAILERISEDLAQAPEGVERPEKVSGKKPKITWEDTLQWADPKVRAEFLPRLLGEIRRLVAPGLVTKTVGRWLYLQDGKTFCVLWVKKRGFMVTVASDPSFRDPQGLSHPVKGFFFPQGGERRFSLVLGDDLGYALELIAEGHRCARSPDFPWRGSRRPARS